MMDLPGLGLEEGADVSLQQQLQLWHALEDISATLKKWEVPLEAMRQGKISSSTPLRVADVLMLAQRTAFTHRSPLGWREGMPLVNAFSPTPLSEHMRAPSSSSSNKLFDSESLSRGAKAGTLGNTSSAIAAVALERLREFKIKSTQKLSVQGRDDIDATAIMDDGGADASKDQVRPADSDEDSQDVEKSTGQREPPTTEDFNTSSVAATLKGKTRKAPTTFSMEFDSGDSDSD